jgi:hypothetical protein
MLLSIPFAQNAVTSKETYLNRTLTPQIVRNAADDALAVALDEKMCKAGSGNATWPALPQGGKYEGKDKWDAMLEAEHTCVTCSWTEE